MIVDALKVVRVNDFDELLGAGCISMWFSTPSLPLLMGITMAILRAIPILFQFKEGQGMDSTWLQASDA